ncbi:transcriptional regulator with PAS, ATPase and Fis domain [Melghirimyces profundicolus]|uniref:HTH-type transcriptional regulatory protein TyrR n=1 Tax=Melghirimyces profundicolus TaxID=1242148 RepID=A0A2T6BCC8_9BACL|nr:sigma 54-interacting transcriptional regulator [Melghirimyces profundicolus]PTX53702.1 transcriptional regulator with PAS, ATPase and Fis domain [Melghirimyces profundicolus]
MYKAMKEKLKPFFCFSVEPLDRDWQHKIHQLEEPFLFLKKHDQVYAYVSLEDLPLSTWKHPDLTVDMLRSCATPLDHIAILHPGQKDSLPLLFQILGNSITLVQNAEHDFIGYIKREEALAELFRRENSNLNFLKTLLSSIPMGIFVINQDRKIVNCNESGLKMIRSSLKQVINADAGSVFDPEHVEKVFSSGETLLNQILITDEMGVLADYSPIRGPEDKINGMIIIVQDLPMVEEMAMELEHVKDLNRDLNAILATMYDEILVVNRNGELLRHSENFISDFWGDDLKTYVGKNLLELEKEGRINSSVIRLVMEKKKKASIVQRTESGKTILAVGNPVFNEDGEIHRIIIASRDITETTQLKSELQKTKKMTRKYKQELDQLKNKGKHQYKLVYCSQKMEQVMDKVQKLKDFDSTVLILGESGVGKELIARSIYEQGNRSDQPFLTINCGAIPEELLESELFGYQKGAFTGANTNGKIGYFQQADKGVLFLDEIGELTPRLQVKLLRVLQEKEVTPVGSTRAIPVDVQIIAATNRNLESMVEEGAFREDLFYRINVIPIQVPPLRERPEDIPLLAFHFIQQLNAQYNKNYHLSPEALNLLEVYSWPGNIRELQNLIERLVVTAEDEIISAEFVHQFLNFNKKAKAKLIVNDLLPFHEAREYVEEQLILMALRKYKTTTKAAKALKISQSAVSRKYQKIMQRKGNASLR